MKSIDFSLQKRFSSLAVNLFGSGMPPMPCSKTSLPPALPQPCGNEDEEYAGATFACGSPGRRAPFLSDSNFFFSSSALLSSAGGPSEDSESDDASDSNGTSSGRESLSLMVFVSGGSSGCVL